MNEGFRPKDVCVAVAPYLRTQPGLSFCKKIKQHAKEICKAPIIGDAPSEHGIGQLENYLAALEDCGWHTKLFSKTGAELKPVLVQKAKEDFERVARQRMETEAPSTSRPAQWQDKDSDWEPEPEREAFDVERVPGLRQMLERVEEQGRYFYGFVLIPPWAAHVLERCAPKAVAIDAGHCSEEQKGVIMEIVISDANRQNVTLAVAHFADNESDRTVDPFFEFASKHLALDRTEVAIHKDGGKSFMSARKAHMPQAKALLCEKHLKGNILEKVKEAGAVEKYKRMVNATTVEKYKFWRQQAAGSRLLEYLESRGLPEEELFLAPFAEAGGKTQATLSTLKRSDPNNPPLVKPRTASGFVESEMGANTCGVWGSIRHSTPTEMVVKVCEKMVQTNASHQAAAKKCATKAPPKVMHMLAVLEKTATEQRQRIVPIGDQRNGQARVYPDLLRSPSLYNVAQLAPATCSCGLPKITGFPCIDLVILAKKGLGATDFTGLLQEGDTTNRWRQQYNFNFAMCLPATAVVFMQQPTDLLFPILAPKPPGAPKRARQKSWAENLTKTARKAVPTSASPAPATPGATSCSSQPPSTKRSTKRPYMCRKCGVPKKGHKCPK